jgi:hypothetical protein
MKSDNPWLYVPNNDEAAVAMCVADIRNRNNGGQTNLVKENQTSDQNRMTNYRGVLAEIAVSRMLNLCWTGCGKGATGLKDVGNLFEVRSIAEIALGLLCRSRDLDSDPFVLVHVDQDRSCQALGWEFAEHVKAQGRVLDAGTDKVCWILRNDQLRPMDLAVDFFFFQARRRRR